MRPDGTFFGMWGQAGGDVRPFGADFIRAIRLVIDPKEMRARCADGPAWRRLLPEDRLPRRLSFPVLEWRRQWDIKAQEVKRAAIEIL